MSNEEKLRALLAEAREMIVSQGIAWKGIAGRIDAALAEPVEGFRFSEIKDAMRTAQTVEVAIRERDEARAEVERLKVQAEAHEIRHRLAASEIRWLLARSNDALHEGNKARAEAVSAFRRGAEAMREAAASCVGGDIALLQTYRSVLERRIRALPVPEER